MDAIIFAFHWSAALTITYVLAESQTYSMRDEIGSYGLMLGGN